MTAPDGSPRYDGAGPGSVRSVPPDGARPSDELWAKSPVRRGERGESLPAHLAATRDAAHRLRDRVGALDAVPERFWDWVAMAALFHDAGKVADGFQAMVSGGPGAARPWGQRHEVLSLGFLPAVLGDLPDGELLWVAAGVLTHHRPLHGAAGPGRRPSIASLYNLVPLDEFTAELGAVDPTRVDDLRAWLAGNVPGGPSGSPGTAEGGEPGAGTATGTAGSFDVVAAAHRLLERSLDTWWRRASAGDGLCAVLLQGAVTLADHVSSAHGVLHARPLLDAGHRTRLQERFTGTGLHPHQRRAAEVEGHLLLRAPTGSGKTEATQLWAATQVESLRSATGGLPRTFYTLPYLASINAMTERMERDLGAPGQVGVAHSRAASYHLQRSLDGEHPDGSPEDAGTASGAGTVEAAARKALSRAAATRLFRETVRVGTPYQLLRGMLAGPAHASILTDSANSVFVLDELHAYDPRRLGMILAAVEFWERLGGRVAIASATLPAALAELVQSALRHPVRVIEPDGPWPARHRTRVNTRHLTDPGTLAAIRERLARGQSVLVVANNVRDARDIHAQLAPEVAGEHGPDACALLHSRFRRGDRSAIERRLAGRFGPGGPRGPGLVVATQVVEVSLDIDLDALHTSAAPLEALLQRFGRVNRQGERPPADVVVHTPRYEPRGDSKEGEEYADRVYEREPAMLAHQILTENDGGTVDERSVTGWLDRVYASEWGQEWRRQVERSRAAFARDFLTFTYPFADRSDLADRFDALFDGEEALLADDVDAYRERLGQVEGRGGRLLAEEYLLPIPRYARKLPRWSRELGVRVLDADYDPETGLGNPRRPDSGFTYSPGEIL